jgi:tetratricopeptide (TPR) repeat protein
LPDWADARELAPTVRSALRGLDARNAEQVARHLVVAGTLVDEDPETALEHARAARDRASRVAAVREAVGVAAYHAGDYAEAARELRAYRRMSGDEGYRAVLADCERALGRPEVSLRLVAEALAGSPEPEEVVELRLVEAGARRDLGEAAAARLILESALGGRPVPELVADAEPPTLRIAAAYAELLAALGEEERAAQWVAALAEIDPEGLLGVGDGPQVLFSEDETVEDEAVEDVEVPGSPAQDGTPGQWSATGIADADPEPVDAESFAAQVEAEVAELLGESDDGPTAEPGAANGSAEH